VQVTNHTKTKLKIKNVIINESEYGNRMQIILLTWCTRIIGMISHTPNNLADFVIGKI